MNKEFYGQDAYGDAERPIEDFNVRLEMFREFKMDYFTIEKTGEKNYRDIIHLFQEWSSRDRFIHFFTQPLKKPHFQALRKKMLKQIKSVK